MARGKALMLSYYRLAANEYMQEAVAAGPQDILSEDCVSHHPTTSLDAPVASAICNG
jgi:hypothetical protein